MQHLMEEIKSAQKDVEERDGDLIRNEAHRETGQLQCKKCLDLAITEVNGDDNKCELAQKI